MAYLEDYNDTEYIDDMMPAMWPTLGLTTTKAEPHMFNEMMVRFAMPMQDDWLWTPTTAPTLRPSMHQSQCATDPAQRPPEVASAHEGHCTSHGPSFGMPKVQWSSNYRDDLYLRQNYSSTVEDDLSAAAYQHVRSSQPSQQGRSPISSSATRQHLPGLEQQIVQQEHEKLQSFLRTGTGLQHPFSTGNDATTQALHPPLTIPWPDVFSSTRRSYKDPSADTTNEQHAPQRKAKRSEEDLYTPRWVRNHGTQREGWCGWCCTWFTLRDSTYWYHMHYSHGISQVDGKRLPSPAGYRAFCESLEFEIKCGKCNKWMPLPPGDRWNTAYFRHTYKCYFKASGKTDDADHSSPARGMISPARKTISNML